MTVSEIIAAALRRIRVLAAGEVPNGADTDLCLSVFVNMVRSLPGFGLGGGLTDVVVTTSPYTAGVNERILWTGSTTLELTLPQLIDTTTSNPRPPRNGDRVAVTSGGNVGVYVYVSSNGGWLLVNNIGLSTADPLGTDCNQALIDMLAFKIADDFGVQPTQSVAQANDTGERLIAARFAPDMMAQEDIGLWSIWTTLPGSLS